MERTEVAEIEALRSMFAAVPDDIAGEFGVEKLELGRGLAVKVGVLSGANEVNHALGISSTEQLEALPGFYGRVRHIVSPEPGVDLDGELRVRGYEPGYAWMKFSRAAGDAPEARTDLEDVGWLGMGATRSEFRRRGAQGAILAARIEKAAQLGCTLVVTETGELVEDRPSSSYRNILRAGFEPRYLRPNYRCG